STGAELPFVKMEILEQLAWFPRGDFAVVNTRFESGIYDVKTWTRVRSLSMATATGEMDRTYGTPFSLNQTQCIEVSPDGRTIARATGWRQFDGGIRREGLNSIFLYGIQKDLSTKVGPVE